MNCILIKQVVKDYCKFRDYCNYTGKHIGVAHCICNLRYIKYLKIFQ